MVLKFGEEEKRNGKISEDTKKAFGALYSILNKEIRKFETDLQKHQIPLESNDQNTFMRLYGNQKLMQTLGSLYLLRTKIEFKATGKSNPKSIISDYNASIKAFKGVAKIELVQADYGSARKSFAKAEKVEAQKRKFTSSINIGKNVSKYMHSRIRANAKADANARKGGRGGGGIDGAP